MGESEHGPVANAVYIPQRVFTESNVGVDGYWGTLMSQWNKFRLAIARRGLVELHKKLVLTYDNTKMCDGVGAQLQRIYGIYSISRLLGASYLHTPVGRVDYQGMSALENNALDPSFHHEFNKLFHIQSDVMPATDFHKIELRDLSMKTVHRLVAMFDRNETGGRPILVQLLFPYQIADRFPDCYEVCKEMSPFVSPVREGRVLRVAVQVRWGDYLVQWQERLLPNSYYINVVQNVARILEGLKIDYQMELHTEVPKKEFTVQDGHKGLSKPQSVPALVNPGTYRLDEFDVLPNLVHRINKPTMDSLRYQATADILITSKSSFGYLAGVLNRGGTVLYHPFWHRPLSSWITVGSNGKFNRSKFVKAVTAKS